MKRYFKILYILILLPIFILGLKVKAATIEINMKDVYWSNPQVVYDGTVKSIRLLGFPEDFPEDIDVTYEDNEFIECGKYRATVSFKYDRDKYALVNVNYPDFRDWQIRQPSVTDIDNNVTISSDYGIDPNYSIVFEELNFLDYRNIDCTIAGTYQEVKMAFGLQMMDGQRPTVSERMLIVEITIPEEFIYVEDLKIFNYSMGSLATTNSERKDDNTLVFRTDYLSDTYLLIGMRNTYTNNNIWKGLLILAFSLVGGFGLWVGHRYRKRKEEQIAIDKEMYRRRFED